MILFRIISVSLLISLSYSRVASYRGVKRLPERQVAVISRYVNERLRKTIRNESVIEPTPTFPGYSPPSSTAFPGYSPPSSTASPESIRDLLNRTIQCDVSVDLIWERCSPILKRKCFERYEQQCSPSMEEYRQFTSRATSVMSGFQPSSDSIFKEEYLDHWFNRRGRHRERSNEVSHFSISITVNDERRTYSSDDNRDGPDQSEFGEYLFKCMLRNLTGSSHSHERNHTSRGHRVGPRPTQPIMRLRRPHLPRRGRMRYGRITRRRRPQNDPSFQMPKRLPRPRRHRRTKRYLPRGNSQYYNRQGHMNANSWLQRIRSGMNRQGGHGLYNRIGWNSQRQPWSSYGQNQFMGHPRYGPPIGEPTNPMFNQGHFGRPSFWEYISGRRDEGEDEDDEDEEDDDDDDDDDEYDDEDDDDDEDDEDEYDDEDDEDEYDDEDDDDDDDDDEDDDDDDDDDEDDNDDDDDDDDNEEHGYESDDCGVDEEISCEEFEEEPANSCQKVGKNTEVCLQELKNACPVFESIRSRIENLRQYRESEEGQDRISIEAISITHDGNADVTVSFGDTIIDLTVHDFNSEMTTLVNELSKKILEYISESP